MIKSEIKTATSLPLNAVCTVQWHANSKQNNSLSKDHTNLEME